jgi:RpiR family carbohydrate utilization transcriptional regulator
LDDQVRRSDLLERLAALRPELSRAEMRVADVVLAAPDSVPRKNLAALAAEADVSEPTVLRFCRSLGLDGYAHFKIALAEALAAGGAAYVHRDIGFGDDVAAVKKKIFDSSISAITDLRRSIDDELLQKAADRISRARRLDLIGVGLANTVASDAQQKFMRLDMICQSLHDGHLQTMSAATLRPEDVLIAFSYNGRIKDVLRSVGFARECGAFVIAITRANSPLARAADLTLAIDTTEDTFLYSPMATRLAHFVMVDLLATLVALGRGPEIVPRLEFIKESLSDQWIVDDRLPRSRRRPAAEISA